MRLRGITQPWQCIAPAHVGVSEPTWETFLHCRVEFAAALVRCDVGQEAPAGAVRVINGGAQTVSRTIRQIAKETYIGHIAIPITKLMTPTTDVGRKQITAKRGRRRLNIVERPQIAVVANERHIAAQPRITAISLKVDVVPQMLRNAFKSTGIL